ncbi:MAG TPA: B-box zinc finger protein [Candidatus Cybelea sp.]|nr:B-box zinc finger protein [Candidatus Cybelea sp.]
MKCATHGEVEATGFCRNCGKPLCPACTREVRGALYCESCLGNVLGGSQAVAVPASGDSRPSIAAALGIIPGLGAVYNGEYIKALVHVVVFAALIAAMPADLPSSFQAFVIVSFIAFCCYMPVDAYRVAKARSTGELAPPDLVRGPARKPIGAIVLIGLGVLLLLANFGLLERDWFAKSWPVALVVLGVWLLRLKQAE